MSNAVGFWPKRRRMKRRWPSWQGNPQVADAIVGFHAQQAVEKWLKALLCHRQVNYQRTHDLALLLDAVADAGSKPTPEVEQSRWLARYAVQFRYYDGPVALPCGLDRAEVQRQVASVGQWVRGEITAPRP